MTARARALRRDMTDAERRLWSRLRGDALGVRFRRQLVIDQRWIADFCAPTVRLIVEVDGGQHVGSPADAQRSAALKRLGYRILRFWNTDVLLATDDVLRAILSGVQTPAASSAPTASPLSPLRGGEGKRPTPFVAPGPARIRPDATSGF